MNNKKRVLMMCWDNTIRSQIAEGFSKDHSSQYEVFSAGVEPQAEIPSLAVKVMKEYGIDISQHTPKSIERVSSYIFDYTITLCEKTKAHFSALPKSHQFIHWDIEDPADCLTTLKRIRDEIHELVNLFASLPEIRAS